MAFLTLGAGLAITILGALMISAGAGARRRQERLTEQISEARDALQAVEEQRQKLSHDLHDNAVQTLYAVQLGLSQTSQKFVADPVSAGEELVRMQKELNGVIAEMRRFITPEGNPERPVDLPAVLRATVQRAVAVSAAQIELNCDPQAAGRLSGSQSVQLANIAREALSNCLRHAKARRVEVALGADNDHVWLEVVDDGVGFSLSARPQKGVGLSSMSQRAQEMGGTLEIQSAPSQGTRVRVQIPVTKSEVPE